MVSNSNPAQWINLCIEIESEGQVPPFRTWQDYATVKRERDEFKHQAVHLLAILHRVQREAFL